jgi:ABC-2 type transport system permease protein
MKAIGTILGRNLTNFVRDRTRLIASLVMSLFFLFVFSFVMKSAMGGIVQPMNYLIAGVHHDGIPDGAEQLNRHPQ